METITVNKFELVQLLSGIQETLLLFSLIDKSDLSSGTMGEIAEFRIRYEI